MSIGAVDPALKKKAGFLVLLILGLIALTLALRLSSLGEWLDAQRLVDMIRQSGAKIGPITAVASVALASTVAIPLAVIILVSAIAFGPWLGLSYALSGACVGAAISYGVGRYLGHDALCHLAGDRVNQLSARLARRGILSVIIIRMLPVAPFAIVNLIAGSTHITMRDFMIGTLVGMLPGGLAIAFLGNYISDIASSSHGSTLLVIGFALLFVLGCWAVKFWLNRQSKS